MQNINQVRVVPTPYRGSENTANMVREQLKQRFGAKTANDYDPYFSCRTFKNWRKIGYIVKKGEKALKSIVVLEEKDEKGKVIKTHPRVINLFHLNQVERLKP